MTRILLPLALISVLLFSATAEAQSGPYALYPLTPCRIVDTRNPVGVNGGPALGTAAREFSIRGNCGVPSTAKAVSINVTVTNPSTSSWLTIWPAGLAKPFISIINFSPSDPALANGAIVGVGSGSRDLAVQNAIGSVHVIIDVTGYFQ